MAASIATHPDDAGTDSGDTWADAATDDSEAAADSGIRQTLDAASDALADDAAVDADLDADLDAGDDAGDAGDGAANDGNVPVSCTETASCLMPVNLGTMWGGVETGVNEQRSTFGDHSEWYRVEVQQYPPPAASDAVVYAAITIEPLADMQLDVDVYYTSYADEPPSCATITASSTGDGGPAQYINFTFQNFGSTIGWITVHVKTRSGAQCSTGATYWLDITTE